MCNLQEAAFGGTGVCVCLQDWTLVLGFGLLLEVTTATLITGLLGALGVSAKVEGERLGREGGQASCSGLLARTCAGGSSARLQSVC